MNILQALCQQFSLKSEYAQNTISLVDEGNTVPFIARYRKELTGSMDDQLLRDFCDRLEYLRSLEKRRNEVRGAIDEQGKLTDDIVTALENATILAEIEDIYRPYKPKRKTRASVARAKGLEPLALDILAQERNSALPFAMAEKYITEEVLTAEDALSGAKDIIAEIAADSAELRKRLRNLFFARGLVITKGISEDDNVFAMYYDYKEPVEKIPGHRVLAINRGEREEKLKVSVELELEYAMNAVNGVFLVQGSPCTDTVREALEDAYSRLIYPSVEREIRNELTAAAAENAIKVFAQNLRPLLMQPPVGGHVVMAIDPGFRTGCKIAVVDPTGRLLDTGVIYPVPPHNRLEQAERTLDALLKKHGVTAIAIGNGTAGRETEQFVAGLLPRWRGVSYVVVNESGASVYSASKLAAQEFPQLDVSLRSAVSLARRLQDPLAELVKIDPKAIGVGQYQHDMPSKRLDEALHGVVEDCVNAVGVDLNTASPSLLENIAGINGSIAKAIVQYREENGMFNDRAALKKVPRLGPKAFEQCAGFLRVRNGKNLLDNTGVHPENYSAVKNLFKICNVDSKDAATLEKICKAMGISKCAEKIGVGIPTLEDILKELAKPGRDPREDLPVTVLRQDVLDIKDLREGMILSGTVRNVIDFGAFVDIGVHQDGLVHISQICDKFLKHPSEILKVGDIVKVKVLSIDAGKKRIGLSIKQADSK
ncbi:MAG: RNA-binding transcriptional accessory protein [Oscillospiraceae bacterium]|nr:RNA-binding transcriptional accessory protein [Oscillospiraceae bacterium]